jgi:hypothetical protein
MSNRPNNYPLKATWEQAQDIIDTLATLANDVDQDWSRYPAHEVTRLANALNLVHRTWMERAEEDGRTW